MAVVTSLAVGLGGTVVDVVWSGSALLFLVMARTSSAEPDQAAFNACDPPTYRHGRSRRLHGSRLRY